MLRLHHQMVVILPLICNKVIQYPFVVLFIDEDYSTKLKRAWPTLIDDLFDDNMHGLETYGSDIDFI